MSDIAPNDTRRRIFRAAVISVTITAVVSSIVILSLVRVGVRPREEGKVRETACLLLDWECPLSSGGSKDTPIVMEGGSIIFDTFTAWSCSTASTVTTCTTALPSGTVMKKIVVKDWHDAGLKNPVPVGSGNSWKVILTTAGNELETIEGTASGQITVTTSSGAQFVLADTDTSGKNPTELNIFPTNGDLVASVDVLVNSVDQGTTPCNTNGVGSSTSPYDYHCQVVFKTKD
jgi:hypothetical protein